jgi:hypothetical protein
MAMRVRAKRTLLGAALLVSPAHAEAVRPPAGPELEVSLEYAAPPGCPNARWFEQTVASRLGYDPFRAPAAHRVLVRIDAEAASHFGHVEWRSPSDEWAGDQSFPARKADCVELARTIALALAVQIHLLAVAKISDAQDAPSPPAAPLPREPDRAKPAALPRESAHEPRPRDTPDGASSENQSTSPARLGIGAGASAGQGLSSNVVGLVRLFALIVRRPLSLELGAEIGLPSTTRRADGAGYTQKLLFGSLAGCGGPTPWSVCVLTRCGMARVRGRDIDVPASDSGAILQTGLRVAISPPLGPHAFLSARVEGLATLTPWTVTLDGLTVWTAPPFSANGGLDLGVFFP